MNSSEKINPNELIEKKTITTTSDIERFDENQLEEIEVKLFNGMPKAMAFFDIDGTLGNFKHFHGQAIKNIFPENNPEDVRQTYLAGLTLGTTYRVFHRVIGIFEEGKEEWRDPQKYLEWLAEGDNQAIVDGEGAVHDKAATYSVKHSAESAKFAEAAYKQNPEEFKKTRLEPVFHLVEIYKRLGIPMAIMTANDEPFAKMICKCLELSDSFIAAANQKDFEGRSKEGAIEFLIEKMKEKNIPIPSKLLVVGDSLNGDIGSGAKFMTEHPEFQVNGVLVGEGDIEKLEKARKNISKNSSLSGMNVEVLSPELIEERENGLPNIAGYRNKYNIKEQH